MNVSIPVSKFSKAIILHEYADTDIINLPQNSPLYNQLLVSRPGDDLKVARLKSLLTETLTFDMNGAYAAHIKNVWRVGFHLHRFHRDRLDDYVASVIPFQVERKAAIETWLHNHGVEVETDISLETLYRHSTRYFDRKKEANIRRFRQRLVCQNGKKSQRQKPSFSLYSDSELDTIAEYYQETFPELFLTQKRMPRKRLSEQLRVYVYRKVGERSPQYCRKVFDIPPRSIRYHVQSFACFLLSAPPIVLIVPEKNNEI